jgi:hypothetical protein
MTTETVTYLNDHPGGAPENVNFRLLYEQALDDMLSTTTSIGCTVFKEEPVVKRIALNAESAIYADFDQQELTFLLACAVDRLAELALDGYAVYRTNGLNQPLFGEEDA